MSKPVAQVDPSRLQETGAPVLHLIYRCCAGENKKGRPSYYSKKLALASFVRSVEQLGKYRGEVIFLCDGVVPEDWRRIMESCGDIVLGEGMGLVGSLTAALHLPNSRGWLAEHTVWLAEDDYLYMPDALRNAVAAAQCFPEADYFGLYALIGARQPNGHAPDPEIRIPLGWQELPLREVESHSWRQALSTTSTFGARVSALLRDRGMMLTAMRTRGAWDHAVCLAYQGYVPYLPSFLFRDLARRRTLKASFRSIARTLVRLTFDIYAWTRQRAGARTRILVSADPALITHMETEFMAVGTDWAGVADDTQRWLAAKSFG